MATPLDEERARLREAGYTDEEISRYFVERLRGEGQAPAAGAGAAPQGNMSGVLGNANAVLGHVRATIPVVTTATANLSNPAVPAKSRLKSAAVLVGIGLIVCVLGFAIWQEWQQHIIAATEIQNAQVRKIQAEADAARALNEAQVKKLQAEAAVAKQLNDAQAQKLKADADAAKALNDAQVKKLEAEAAVAKQVNDAQAQKLRADADAAKALNDAQVKKLESEAAVAKELNEAQTRKTHAEECSARMKAAIDTMPMDKLLNGGTDSIQRDCDPAYMAHAKACDEKFGLVISAIDTIDLDDQDANGTLKKAANKYKEDCSITAEQHKLAEAALERRKERIGKIPLSELIKHVKPTTTPTPPPSPSSTSLPQTASLPPPVEQGDATQDEIESAWNRGDYDGSYKLAVRHAEFLDAHNQPGGEYSPWLEAAWRALLCGYYTSALEHSNRSMQYTPGGDKDSKLILAFTLMMMDRTHEAKSLIDGVLSDPNNGDLVGQEIRNDFAEMRKAGITHPMMAEIEASLK